MDSDTAMTPLHPSPMPSGRGRLWKRWMVVTYGAPSGRAMLPAVFWAVMLSAWTTSMRPVP